MSHPHLSREHAHILTSHVVDALLTVTLAPRCAACARQLESPTAGPICAACWAAITPPSPPLCRACGESLPSWRLISTLMELCPRCRRRSRPINVARTASTYEAPVRDIIHAFKYEGRRSLAVRLAAMMRAAGRDVLRDAACVIPVPMHAWRRLRRGFNQASDLARRLDRPLVHALWRTRATAMQAGLSARARRTNVRDAFTLSPLLFTSTRARYIERRIVVLVDDVTTTGATLDACAEVLKRAGAHEVRALTVAHAVSPNC